MLISFARKFSAFRARFAFRVSRASELRYTGATLSAPFRGARSPRSPSPPRLRRARVNPRNESRRIDERAHYTPRAPCRARDDCIHGRCGAVEEKARSHLPELVFIAPFSVLFFLFLFTSFFLSCRNSLVRKYTEVPRGTRAASINRPSFRFEAQIAFRDLIALAHYTPLTSR